ncbi:MAG TPA: hypothetical protein VGB42_06240 [Candidatus Thermoplasmatota archaeon]
MAPAKRKRTAEERRQDLLMSVRDLAFAAVAVAVIIGGIWAYAGVWPPMVVVESGSMMHEKDASALGVIDTGDLTLVKSVGSASEIRTYMQGQADGYKTYGNFGDVVIYAKNCDFSQTPIIHRAITRMVLNASRVSFDFPELAPPVWDARAGDTVTLTVWTYHVNGPVGQEMQVSVSVGAILSNMGSPPHGGFLTKGDNNGGIDQLSLSYAPGHGFVEPVEEDCVLGVARGELPWFGVIKLWAGGSGDSPPQNSVTSLIIALIAIVTVPFALEVAWDRFGDRVKSRVPERWRHAWHRLFDRLPGGKRRAHERAEREQELAARRAREERRKRGRRRGRDDEGDGGRGGDDGRWT